MKGFGQEKAMICGYHNRRTLRLQESFSSLLPALIPVGVYVGSSQVLIARMLGLVFGFMLGISS